MPRNLNNITQTNGYTVVKPNIPLEWSSMYMAQTNQGTGYCGKIIPVFWKELMPNQTVNVEQSVALQFTPFVSNLFHQIRGELMSFFVPYRICAFMRETESIDGDTEEEADQLKWQGFITGGKNGQDNRKLDTISWKILTYYADLANKDIKHTLWDYFGMPTHVSHGSGGGIIDPEDNPPNKLLHNAYNLIYNTKFRNPDYTNWKRMVVRTGFASDLIEINETATAYWNADRFTRARAAQYRGIAPTIPISNDIITLAHNLSIIEGESGTIYGDSNDDILDINGSAPGSTIPNQKYFGITIATQEGGTGHIGEKDIEFTEKIDDHTIAANAINARIDYNEFLYNLAILKYETNNARIKPLYVEQLKYRFGVIPQDSRFQEPEWVASNSFNIGIDINQATAGTTQISKTGETLNYTQNDQGKITSQAWGSGSNLKSEYKALEHGVFMTLMIIRPEGVYEGGLDRHLWGDRTRLSFPTPELMNTPDQEIWTGELYWTGDMDDDKVGFGWEQVYDQDRTMTNQVCGLLRPSITSGGLRTYTLARYWDSNNIPVLNDNFLLCKPDMTRIKQYQNQPDFIFFTRSEIKTALPMPIINEPVDIGM